MDASIGIARSRGEDAHSGDNLRLTGSITSLDGQIKRSEAILQSLEDIATKLLGPDLQKANGVGGGGGSGGSGAMPPQPPQGLQQMLYNRRMLLDAVLSEIDRLVAKVAGAL